MKKVNFCFLLAPFVIGILLLGCNQESANTTATPDSTDGTSAKVAEQTKNIIPPGPVPNTIMTKEYVTTLAKNIYLWGWPLVNVHNRVANFNQLKEPMYIGGVLPGGPINHMCMLTDYMKAEQRVVACPNQDVVYGAGPIDLRKEPVVIQVPDFGDRFWVYQVADQRTDGFAKLGKMYNSKAGTGSQQTRTEHLN